MSDNILKINLNDVVKIEDTWYRLNEIKYGNAVVFVKTRDQGELLPITIELYKSRYIPGGSYQFSNFDYISGNLNITLSPIPSTPIPISVAQFNWNKEPTIAETPTPDNDKEKLLHKIKEYEEKIIKMQVLLNVLIDIVEG